MSVDAVLIVKRRIDEVIREAGDRRKFSAGLLIEIGVAPTTVDRPVTQAEVGETRCIVRTDRKIHHPLNHVIVHALIPAQRGLQENIAESRPRVADAALCCEPDRPQRAGDRGVDSCLLTPGDCQCSNGKLSTENGRCEYVGRAECNDVCSPFDFSVQVDRQVC